MRIASLYLQGIGVSQDYAQVKVWCERAANEKFPTGMLCLGIVYEKGAGAAMDKAAAASWYQKAADLGETNAMLSLAGLYSRGEGVVEDQVAAYMWLLIAKRRGNGNADALLQLVAAKLNSKQAKQAQKKAESKDWKIPRGDPKLELSNAR